jgi:hypothetical protein
VIPEVLSKAWFVENEGEDGAQIMDFIEFGDSGLLYQNGWDGIGSG